MAEFQKVISEWNRMCNYYDECTPCLIRKASGNVVGETTCTLWVRNHPEEIERIIMQWAAEHPIKTNGMKFNEVFGYRFADKIKTPEDIMTWLFEEYKGGQE